MIDPIHNGSTCAIHEDVRSTGLCSHCGNFGCDDCLGYLRGELVCQDCVLEGRVEVYPPTPWERRQELGLLAATWQTVWAITSRPAPFFRTLDPAGSVAEAMGFAAAAAGIGGLVLGVLVGGLLGVIGLVEGGASSEILFAVPFMVGFLPFIAVLQALFGALFMGLIHHGVLKLLGGGGKGLEATLRASLYAWGLQFWLMTVCGYYLVSLWVAIVQIFAYAEVHGDSHGKTVATVFAPLFLCGGAYVAIVLFAMVLGA